ncbi:hypothetical protein VNO77_21352 [Canavalia gladiata]|uniref:Uncharacterized protein n=1 Tax=Canavalia gladiata TaxID=3824 RepID=A0AAN9LW01_CANGL
MRIISRSGGGVHQRGQLALFFSLFLALWVTATRLRNSSGEDQVADADVSNIVRFGHINLRHVVDEGPNQTYSRLAS